MRCMACLEKIEMNCVYKGVVVCSEDCRKNIEDIGIERLIINKEERLKRSKLELKALQSEKECEGITFEGVPYGRRTKEEISEDIEDTKTNISTLENQIPLLKQHNDVRLKYLF